MILNRFYSSLNRFCSDRSGNFALVTAMMMFPMVAAAGISIDLWRAYDAKAKLDQVADSAAMAAISTSSKAYANVLTGNGKADWNQEAKAFFAGNNSASGERLPVEVTADVQRNGLLLTSTVTYTSAVRTLFMGIAGFRSITIRGGATAEFNTGEYYDVNVLVDNSPSMGIGASQKDVDVMNAKMDCAFACHDLSGKWNTLPQIPRLGVKLRIDVVASSLLKLADMVSSGVTQKGLYRLSLYTLGAKAEEAIVRPLAKLQESTQDMDAFKASVKAVALMSVPSSNFHNYAVGYINKSVQMLGAQMPASGTGTGRYNPRQVLLLITDGVEDILSTPAACYGVYQYGRCTQYIDVSQCQSLKKSGITIAVLHTLYLPITTNDNYDMWVKPFASKIDTALQTCASPNLYKAVDMNSDISKALNELFARAVGMPRLAM